MNTITRESLPRATTERPGFQAWGIYGHTGDPSAECLVDGNTALGILPTDRNSQTDNSQ